MAQGIRRRSFLGGMATAGVALLVHSLPTASASSAASAEGMDWERLGPDLGAERLFAPASGALFAATTEGVWRLAL